MNVKYVEEIVNCARCGETHVYVEMSVLNNHAKYTHFAPCPTNGQPILIKFDEPDGNCNTIIFTNENDGEQK